MNYFEEVPTNRKMTSGIFSFKNLICVSMRITYISIVYAININELETLGRSPRVKFVNA